MIYSNATNYRRTKATSFGTRIADL